MENRHFRLHRKGGRLLPISRSVGNEEDIMERDGRSRRGALALARRDLLADWRGWSAAEKSAAIAALATVALTPFLALSQLLSS